MKLFWHTLFPFVIVESANVTLNIIVLSFYFIILCKWVFCLQICLYHVHAVPMEARKGPWISWN